MELGAFSLSLPVEDLTASKKFYGALGFEVVGGDIEQNWLILRNQGTTIGLFKGMFEKPMLSFNPGWDSTAMPLESFTDIRDLARQLEGAGVSPIKKPDPGTQPTSMVLEDPDGNPVLIDQHVSA